MILNFKKEEDKMLFSLLHPALIMIYTDLHLYAWEKHRVNLVITQTVSTMEQDKKLGRVSSSHREHRAIDIRTKDLPILVVNDLVSYINTRWAYKKYHYLSNSGSRRLAYFHHGSEQHIHLAIGAQYAITNSQSYQ